MNLFLYGLIELHKPIRANFKQSYFERYLGNDYKKVEICNSGTFPVLWVYLRMIKRLYSTIFILFLFSTFLYGQADSNEVNPNISADQKVYVQLDSAGRAQRKADQDSIRAIRDSLSIMWVKTPDPNRPNKFQDSLLSLYIVKNLDFVSWANQFKKRVSHINQGQEKPKGETWIIGVILFLILFFSLIKFFFPSELNTIITAFYSNQILTRINKEDNLFNSWPFVFFYVLFGLIIGLYFYLSGKYLQLSYPIEGFELFLFLSVLVIGMFTLKIILLRFFGFLFDVNRIVREYVSVLYLSYFNTAILFLPVVIAFSLTSNRFAGIYSYIGIALLTVIFVIQFLRAGSNILSKYKFPKVYLIIYLCTLEFCPLIILFKALGY